jgi:hypothetical protein
MLTPTQQLVLSKIKIDENLNVAPGSYHEKFTVEVNGMVTVGEDSESQVAVPWKKIALCLLDGLSDADAAAVARKALSFKEDKNLEERIKAKLALKLGKNPRKGSVTGVVLTQILEGTH